MTLPLFIAARKRPIRRAGRHRGRLVSPERDNSGSGDDVGDARIDHPLDLVLEHQLAALQPGDFELVAGRLCGEKPDPFVEVAVLGLERFERLPAVRRRSSSPGSTATAAARRNRRPVHGEQHRGAAEA